MDGVKVPAAKWKTTTFFFFKQGFAKKRRCTAVRAELVSNFYLGKNICLSHTSPEAVTII